jgi:3-oxoacyl-[acyl-carrier protein] reductase
MKQRMVFDFSGRHALVGGGTRGIGLATARMLADGGASVTLVGRQPEVGAEALRLLDTSQGQQHRFLSADHAEPEDFMSDIHDLLIHHPVHILINNSGGPPPGPLLSEPTEKFLSVFQQHLLTSHRLVQAVVPGMKAANYGRIIQVISTSVKAPLANLGVSNTVRGAVASWAKTLATELGPSGITVNNVLPGATATERLEGIIANKANKTGESLDAISREMLAEIPLNRFAQPEETAAAIAFLASPLAGYITGINLPVDGGRLTCL